ncbi:cysteine and tyrosine-rich protein 1-like [Ruditapes philippinarum]|uniref:cysteine and tyrosine-rich protein 1-like n=1 Tax=Ruditapes philippinarum TaxID=129788 RepID=UPI00295A5EC4|nr:cysteine and tyrosine-rich protein 1-like [Ruditapes philippinarum]
MKNVLFWIIFGLTQTEIARAGETCTDYDRYNDVYFYCDNGCCGSWPYEYCCEDTVWLGWAIAGGVIGGIFLISFVVCVVCVCVKQKGKTGRIVQPESGTTVSHVATYPQSQGYYPQSQGYYPQYATTGFIQNPSAPPPPPAYQSIYGQQPLPPLPSGFQGHQQQGQQHTDQAPPPIGFK